MKREYWHVVIVYIVMQLSSIIGIPLTAFFLGFFGKSIKFAVPYWLIFSFSAALIIIMLILRKEIQSARFEQKGSPLGTSIFWAFFGVFLSFFSQIAAGIVERLIGVPAGSQNTEEILTIIETFPLAVLVSSIIAPILEELVFRKILFGALYKRFNFFVSALISSVIFAIAHMDPQHILLYAAMGITFAFLYVKTKHIAVPMFAHTAMNTMVVLNQLVFHNDIERLNRDAHNIQNFIGGFL